MVGNANYRYVEWFDELNADILVKKTLPNADEFIEGIKLERMQYLDGVINYEGLGELAQTHQFTELAYNKKMAKEIGDSSMVQAIDDLFKTGAQYNQYKQEFDSIFNLFDDYGDISNIVDTYENTLNIVVSTVKQTSEVI